MTARSFLPPLFLGALFAISGDVFAEEPDPRPVPSSKTFVHIDTDRPLALRRLVGRFGEDLCFAPCDKTIAFDPKDRFSVEGAFMPGGSFQLGPGGGRVDLRVDTGSRAAHYGGLAASIAGGGTLTITSMLFVLLTLASLGSGQGVDPEVQQGLLVAGAAGGAAFTIGLPLVLVSQTKVEVLPNPARTQARGMITVLF